MRCLPTYDTVHPEQIAQFTEELKVFTSDEVTLLALMVAYIIKTHNQRIKTQRKAEVSKRTDSEMEYFFLSLTYFKN